MKSDAIDGGTAGGAGDFERRMLGNFVGMLRWPQFDALWQRLRRTPHDWFIVRADRPAPLQPADAETLVASLDELEALLKRELGAGYCGVVYVDDPDDPGLVKIFDPRTLGTMCSCASMPAPPAWVLSSLRPVRFPAPPALAAERSGWWARWRAR